MVADHEVAAEARRHLGAPGSASRAQAAGPTRAGRRAAVYDSALADRSPGEVVVGEHQRAAVARALAPQPRLLLADEPTSHQDARLVGAVLAHLRAAASCGTAVVFATHDLATLPVANRVRRMRDGRLDEVAP